MLKKSLYIVGFALIAYAILEQTQEKPNVFVQILAVIFFFGLMMRLTQKTTYNSDNKDKDEASF